MPKSVQYIEITVIDGVNYVITATDNILYYKVAGTATLTSNWSITVGAGAIDGMRFHMQWIANVTGGGNHAYICGAQVPDNLLTKNFDVTGFYNGSSWTVRFLPDFEETGIVDTADIMDDAVTNDKLASITRGYVKVGGVGDAPTDLNAKTSGQILVGDGTDLKSVAMSGDATIIASGAITIANDAVDNNKLANITRGYIKVGGAGNAPTDLDAKTSGYILIGDGTDLKSVPVSGDITIDSTGLVTVVSDGLWEVGSGNDSCQRLNSITSSVASGDFSYSEGINGIASGDYSHAEGSGTTASGTYSHSEGLSTTSSGDNSSHSEGVNTIASGDSGSHAEGNGSLASGDSSHSEGAGTIASGNRSHAEGDNTVAIGACSHAEGEYSVALYYASTARSGGSFGATIKGNCQNIISILKKNTTDATPVYLLHGDATTEVVIPTDCTANVLIRITAVQYGGTSGSVGDSFSQIIKCAIKNIAGTSSVVPTAAVTLANYSVESGDILYEIPFKDSSFGGSIAVSVAANTLHIQATGEANKSIHWSALVDMSWIGHTNFDIVP